MTLRDKLVLEIGLVMALLRRTMSHARCSVDGHAFGLVADWRGRWWLRCERCGCLEAARGVRGVKLD